MQWKVAKELADSPAIAWSKGRLAGFDWSCCEWITVRRGAWGGPGTSYSEEYGGWTSCVADMCRYPHGTRSGLYRLNCRVNTRLGWPAAKRTRVSPLYMNEDGTWPPVPEGHMVGQWFVDENTGREWQRLYRTDIIEDEEEALVFIIAHEAFHYLRRTRQIDGTNTEINADAYAWDAVKEWRRECLSAA
jgi:hypothetical protein